MMQLGAYATIQVCNYKNMEVCKYKGTRFSGPYGPLKILAPEMFVPRGTNKLFVPRGQTKRDTLTDGLTD